MLTIEGLTICADGAAPGAAPLVDALSLRVGPGEVLGIIGESGAGKSTVGLAALGYIRPGCKIIAGRITFAGQDVLRMPEHARQRLRGQQVAYIAQSAAASFNPAIRIGHQIGETLVTRRLLDRRAAKQRTQALLAELQIPAPAAFFARFPHQASGGQLQRAMAAMAMSGGPKLLVFDEPTTALDVTTQVEVLGAFRKLVREHGMAAIYISHDLAVVAQMADRVMVLRQGRLVEQGPVMQILQAPADEYTRALVGRQRQKLIGNAKVADSNRPVLQITNLSAGYRKTAVLEAIDIALPRASTVAVVGESGSGKTTLGRVIAGLLPPMQGAITLNGQVLPPTVPERTKDQLRQIQLVHQMPDVALNPRHSVLETIGRPVRFYFGHSARDVRARVVDLLEQTELPASILDRPTRDLSGGQKQRICIARALAASPTVMICDEITGSLDQLVAEGILRLLSRLQAQTGISYIFITHDLGLVRRIAHEVIIMRHGRVIERGHPDLVMTDPTDPYTRLLLSSVPEVDPQWLTQALATRSSIGRISADETFAGGNEP